MVEDKYIGLILAVSGSVFIGTSFIITKKGLNDAGKRNSEYANASDDLSYLKNPIWWAGISTLANFAAYTFAPPILVTPLGALSVLIGAVLASFLLDEELGHIGRVGCTLCFIGSIIIVLHAPPDKDIRTVDEMLHYALQPGFLLYCFTVLVFTLVMINSVVPKYGRKTPIVYISICSLVGSIGVMAIKGFGVAVKLTFGGNNQFTSPSTYVFAIVVTGCIVIQMNYFNKALDIFSTNVVNPMYYVGFSTATIVSSLILFQGLNTDDPVTTASLLLGFIVTFLGVHLLNISRLPEPVHAQNGHTALESGLMNPRLSLGRSSIDGWGMVNGLRPEGVPLSAGHRKQGSLFRHQSNVLFSAFDEADEEGHEGAGRDGNAVALHRLQEEPDDDGYDADERTLLRSADNRERRANSASPSQDENAVRRSPQPI
ncbi:DUF803-domain-containing protein [Rickenella mellea]|uniref:DUF803-domain-containing protein n=1 Tax=Rickenella mellea TaxID=50990 RepID=A0A4Y7QAZ5_9AGAM|nr:DUF803-domain-containing protein [Rickenella mellea]